MPRVAGSLIGLSVGDALGAPLEGFPPPDHLYTRMRGGGLHGLPAGAVTDDTLQACAVAESLICCRKFDPSDIMRRFLEGFDAHPEFYGPTSRAVFSAVRAGIPLKEAALWAHRQSGRSRSNGSVMRGAPIGIFYPPGMVAGISVACSRLTHFDPVAAECSVFVNRMISHLCRGADRRTAYRHALAKTRDPEVRGVMASLHSRPLEPTLDALDTIHCAVSLLLASRSFSSAVIGAVNLGGDADTAGAVTGALAGAAWGIDAVPRIWLDALQERDRLLALSRRLNAAAIA
ncbi:MAG: ADP-ribosylglycohydrolase family protein [Methanomicrobiales archaeon]|nr:ADP-ribosylglycohydrolase family protein [Methanomicrobiales archaeon]